MQLAKCDWLGVAFAMAWGCCLILALQWGGVTKKWNDGSVIATLVMIPVIPVLFFTYEWWLGENAMFKLAPDQAQVDCVSVALSEEVSGRADSPQGCFYCALLPVCGHDVRYLLPIA